MRQKIAVAAALLLASRLPAQQTPTPDAAFWWQQTTALANDGMEGRDTGTAAYERAARYVADQFGAFGLKPAGDNGTFFQRVPMHQVDLDATRSSITVEPPSGAPTALTLLHQVTLLPTPGLPPDLSGKMTFLGYADQRTLPDLHGRIAVFFAGTPASLSAAEKSTFAARRAQRLTASGALATVSILNPADIEPFHWPAAYARTVTIAGASNPPAATATALRLSPDAAPALFAGSPHPWAGILAAGTHGAPLPSFDLPSTLKLHIVTTAKDISSPNILATLPGSDPNLAPEFVALSAHLDGYGYGTPVNGDKLYNGALDDAAYVATLLELAKTEAALPPSKRPRRTMLFCIFTGEEKGLLGSIYFTSHPTVPVSQIVADLNLDQLRPIFSLHILTMEGISDSTLGDTARSIAARYSIELRPDREPERNLFRRADNYSFVRVGVPIASFIFGYNPGSPEERVYLDWYTRRYHKPQDDLATPIDWQAAATFNHFYRDLAIAIADNPTRPRWSPSSAYAPSNKISARQP